MFDMYDKDYMRDVKHQVNEEDKKLMPTKDEEVDNKEK